MTDRSFFSEYEKLFIEENHKINLISKNDEKYLWEKHICDSLSLELFFNKYHKPHEILDIGTGGGFPSVPLAILHPEIKITALDSISKKIRAVETFKDKLELKNLTTVCSRVENYDKKFEFITSRAVASLKNICTYALPKLKQGGYFAAFKSRRVHEEIEQAQEVLKKYRANVTDIIKYDLPLEENFERCLVIIKL